MLVRAYAHNPRNVPAGTLVELEAAEADNWVRRKHGVLIGTGPVQVQATEAIEQADEPVHQPTTPRVRRIPIPDAPREDGPVAKDEE